MADVSFKWSGAKITEVGLEAAERDLRRRGNRVLNAARRNVSVDSGRLKASLKLDVEREGRGVVVRVGSNLDYARYEEEGTGVYAGRGFITPKTGKFLRWPATNNSGSGRRRYKDGSTAQWVFARKVRGRKGTRFLSRALRAAK